MVLLFQGSLVAALHWFLLYHNLNYILYSSFSHVDGFAYYLVGFFLLDITGKGRVAFII